MSKLGAICDKLRQNGHTSVLPEMDDISPEVPEGRKGFKRESSPGDLPQKFNKRKNFRPISLNNRAEKNEPPPKSEPDKPSSPSSVKSPSSAELQSSFAARVKSEPGQTHVINQQSVIVRNPKNSPDGSRSSSSPSGSEASPRLRGSEESPRYGFNGVSPWQMEESRRMMSAYYGAAPPMFQPPQFFPFIDYRNMSMLYPPTLKLPAPVPRKLSPDNVEDSLNLEDDEDDGSMGDSEDGKPSSERQGGTLSSERDSHRETGSHDSDGWKWSGVRNSIRSLDIWQYVKHYRNDEMCQSAECRTLGLKEHFHCLTCPNKVIFRKEEMIRHVKWHKKRDETLQLGFLRFSGSDDCSTQFTVCPHAGRQTHYHCLMNGCQKVYTSTSDVQMHANLHRKEMAINKEGFRRYRAMDDCGEESCPFRDQKSTHFHCIRSSCSFTFKNKADMEKHKAYHAKNDELGKDGFRKYMKYEHCLFDNCPYSKIMNHIHCVRQGCRYVFTSSAQLHAHKRKHDKNDVIISPGSGTNPQKYTTSSNVSSDSEDSEFRSNSQNNLIFSSDEDDDEVSGPGFMDLSEKSRTMVEKPPFNSALLRAAEAANMNSLTRQRENDFGSPQARKNMAVSHLSSDNGSAKLGLSFPPISRSPTNPTDFSPKGAAIARPFLNGNGSLHGLSPGSGGIQAFGAMSPLSTLMMSPQMAYPPFKRKRGRPPKNPVIDVHVFPSTPSANHNPQAMFSSFKLGKGGVLMDIRQESATYRGTSNTNGSGMNGDRSRERAILPKPLTNSNPLPEKSASCAYQSCVYSGKDHYHCDHPRCHFASERDDILALHRREFHANIEILEGYEFFDQSVDCELAGCASNRLTRHFHCVRPNCLYSFVRPYTACFCFGRHCLPRTFFVKVLSEYSGWRISAGAISEYDTMATHEEKHRAALNPPSPRASAPFTMTHPAFHQRQTETRPERLAHKTEEFEEGRFFFHPMLSKMHFSSDKPCIHRICRMAEREHFHCNRCEQPYTSPLRLQTHLTKCRAEPPPSPSLSPPAPSPVFGSKGSVTNQNGSPVSARSSPSVHSEDSENSDLMKGGSSGNQKKIKFISVAFPQNGRSNGQQHQPVPEGFQRFLCTETCDWEECPLSRKQTHWHCQEEHCRQFFSDKTRLLRHSERHRRLSTIIGDDFRRYSSKVSCDDASCSLQHSSHVHCLQCDFTCTETAKISTHRRSHSKQNAVSAAGFDKFSFRSPCSVSSCLYYTQTHYHCKTCSVVVNTMSQMQMHQAKHDFEQGLGGNPDMDMDVKVDDD